MSLRSWLVATATATSTLLAGCVGTDIMGFELGPNASSALVITGVIPPTFNTGGCTFVPGGPDLLAGEMEFGDPDAVTDPVAGQYLAVLEVTNRLLQSQQQQRSLTYGQNFGTTNSNDIEIVGAMVRYDFPDFGISPTRPRSTNKAYEGLLSGMSTPGGGSLGPQQVGGVLVTLVRPDLLRALNVDPEVQDRTTLGGTVEPFDVIAYVTLEGRTSSGGRITSNEYAFRIRMSQKRIRNCAEVQAVCDARDDPNATPPQNFEPEPGIQCGFLVHQDFPECSGACVAAP